MWVFPLAAALVAFVFAGSLVKRNAVKRRPHEIAWAIALLLFACGSLAMFLGVLSGWTSADYRAYWLLGAVLNVPYLAMGELYLLVRTAWVRSAALLLLIFATSFAFNRVRTAAITVSALAVRLPLGRDVWAHDKFVLHLAQIYAYPTYTFLIVGTLWSAWKMRSQPNLRDRFVGTLQIAIGATIVAAGSAFAATGFLPGFSITLAVGIYAMFRGFLRASKPGPVATAPASASGGQDHSNVSAKPGS
jgi:hypothetical protein